MKELVNKLGLDYKDDQLINGQYIIKVSDSDNYSKLYSALENLSDIQIDPEDVTLDEHINKMIYSNDTYEITLIADFDNEEYKCIIKEK